MPQTLLMKSGLHGITSQSAQKVPCKKIEPLKSCAFIRFAQECSAHSTSAAEMDIKCGDALFALGELAWCRRQASRSLEVLASMACSLTIRC